jgi:hypothetical protein
MTRRIEMTTTHLRLPASELAKFEPARPRGIAHAEPTTQAVPAPRRLRRAVRALAGFARA